MAGKPHEYFRPEGRFWSQYGEISTPGDYVDRLLSERASSNGVFGAKISWRHLLHFERACRILPHYHQKPLPDILSDLFPEVHYVRITRRDKLRQAVSFWKAYQTGVWGRSTRKEDSPTRAAAFDYDRITEVIHMLLQQETGLDEFLARSGVPHFTVVYEEFIDAYEETVRAVLQHVGIQVPKNLVIDAPQTARQADADTEAWVERYRQIMQERGQNSYSVSGPVP